MATETLRPTVRTAPASGVGGSACSGSTNTANCNPRSTVHEVQVRESSLHHTWATATKQQWYSALVLKVSWSIIRRDAYNSGNCKTGVGRRTYLEYSLNAGVSWTDVPGFPKDADSCTSTSSGTSSVTLAVGQDLTKLRVRIYTDSQRNPSTTTVLDCAGDNMCQIEGRLTDVWTEGTYTEPTGACCNGSSCSIKTQAQCTGTYLGDDTTCSPDPCSSPPPTGACCNGSTCTIKTQADCTGTWQGAGTDCSPNPCSGGTPTGACCTGTVCEVKTEANCDAGGGLYKGNGTGCTPTTCPIGAFVAIVM